LIYKKIGILNLQRCKYYKLAADQGDDRAQNLVGIAYENGYGVEKNEDKAMDYYYIAADKRNLDAIYNLERLSNK